MDGEELDKVKAHQVLTGTHTQKLTLLLFLLFRICHSTGHEGGKTQPPNNRSARNSISNYLVLSKVEIPFPSVFMAWVCLPAS